MVRVCLRWMRAGAMPSAVAAAHSTHSLSSLLFLLSSIHPSWLLAGPPVDLEKHPSALHSTWGIPKALCPPLFPGLYTGLINNVPMSVRGALKRTVSHIMPRLLAVFIVICLAKLPSDIYHPSLPNNHCFHTKPSEQYSCPCRPINLWQPASGLW